MSNEQYDQAIETLNYFIEDKKEFPNFKERADRYLTYAVELIKGIQAKRSFPGMQMLAMAKQKELHDKALRHYADLKLTLQRIEKIADDVRLEDLRLTVWVIKALVHCFFAIVALAFFMEASGGVFGAANHVVDDSFSKLINVVFERLGM